MAKNKRSDKDVSPDVAVKQAYQRYYSEMRKEGKQPMTFYHWKKSGRRRGYGGTKGGTRATARLRRSERKRVGLPD